MIAAKIIAAGVEVQADHISSSSTGGYVVQLDADGARDTSTTHTPLENHDFGMRRMATAIDDVNVVVLDANLSENSIRFIANRAYRKKIPVYAVAVSEEKVLRLCAAQGYLSGIFLRQNECNALMKKLGLLDPAELSEWFQTMLVINHDQQGAMIYTPDGKRIRTHAYKVERVNNLLGTGTAFAAGMIDGLVNYEMDVVDAAMNAESLIKVVAESPSANGYSMNALDSMIGGLYQESRNDMLTGLLARRAFEEEYYHHNKSHKGGRNTLLLIDCDHFKRVNDTIGHDAGDRVLKLVAGLIANSLRTTDVACRWGGDEFVVLLPRTDSQEAEVVAERMRRAAMETDLHGVTLSIGMTSCSINESLEDAMNRADSAMYMAKHNGKNASFWIDAIA